MSAHTPGPWAVEDYRPAGRIRIVSTPEAEGPTGFVLAEVIAFPLRKSEPAEANARLIAAAPKMAALLLSGWQHVSHGGPTRGEVEDVLREAGLIQ